jgi:hypothetical protein
MSQQIVNRSEIINILSQRPGALFIGFVAKTKADTLAKSRDTKEPNPFGEITKVSEVSALANAHYDRGVLRALVKEGKLPERVSEWLAAGVEVDEIFARLELEKIDNPFRRGESWHVPALDASGRLTPFAQHKKDASKLYLRVSRPKTNKARYYAEDGTELSYEQVKPWLREVKPNENQGLDSPLAFRTYSLDSLVAVSVDGGEYLVAADVAA